jgi:hypothetical protein
MKTAEPKKRVIHYRKVMFLCTNSGHDAGVVYLWRRQWYCSPCLKRAVRANGGTASEAYNCVSGYGCRGRVEFRAEAVRRSAPMERVTPRHDLAKRPKQNKAKPEWCDMCEKIHGVGRLCA